MHPALQPLGGAFGFDHHPFAPALGALQRIIDRLEDLLGMQRQAEVI